MPEFESGLVSAVCRPLDVDPCIARVALNEIPARRNLITHQHREKVICFNCRFNTYPLQRTVFRIHCCFPKLFWVHFSKTLISLDVDRILFAFFGNFFYCFLTLLFCPAIASQPYIRRLHDHAPSHKGGDTHFNSEQGWYRKKPETDARKCGEACRSPDAQAFY